MTTVIQNAIQIIGIYKYTWEAWENEKLYDLCKVLRQQLSRTQQKLEQALGQRGVPVSEDLHEELKTVVDKQSPFIAESPRTYVCQSFLGEPRKSTFS